MIARFMTFYKPGVTLGLNLLSVSQLLDEGFEVRFKEGCSRVLDSREIWFAGLPLVIGFSWLTSLEHLLVLLVA